MKGKVKFFKESKNFGFIEGEDGKDYFVHISGINDGVELNENDNVEFEVEKNDRGLKAINVSLTSEDGVDKDKEE